MSRRRKILLATLLISLISFNPGANENSMVVIDKLVPNNVRLNNANSEKAEYARVEKTVNSFLRKWSIAGASIAIAREGKLVYAKGFGYADTALKIPTQPYHLFRVASISKLVTAVAIMKLQEEGKLSVNDKVFGVDGILNDPFFSEPKDKRVYSITVGHLLSHEAGWTQRYGDQMFMPILIADKMGIKPPVDTKTIVRFALNKRLHYTPGTGRAYSNLGYSILGLIIEKVSGMEYGEYCRKAILEPIGIYDMKIAGNLPSEKAPFEVTYYVPSDVVLKPSIYGTGELVPPNYGGNDIRTLGGAGAWLATAPDLMRLLLSVDGMKTKPDILSDESISLMTDNNQGFAPVGWKTTVYNGTWWRTGSFPGSAGMMKRQSDGISWVVLFNSSAWNGPEIYSYINNMMYRVIAQVQPWPEEDLFTYSLPVPLKTTMDEYQSR
ncbi:MAG: beta-lactamase family protein [Bacteroidales bacterium]|nr:beta-lactamase family protein [Bacteroidales bacterium]MBK7627932.1 beta-lactamase family protein [Bacteroidales bacterium]